MWFLIAVPAYYGFHFYNIWYIYRLLLYIFIFVDVSKFKFKTILIYKILKLMMILSSILL